ncbi:MAG: tRNA pseudouridine(38-40) synthase TruA [Pseudoflavonifractor sp.]|nr:tRNA pseudouridine(38-40) synthase TruA [Alloprevotella sp.]MCM1117135.1 tRNA pseudouridine(38-40) synthase TruA [Pseudoflavonifractor sp.]
MDTPISRPTDSAPSLRRYFMRLAFRGEPFHGWQRQPADISVQQVMEEALATVFRLPSPVAVTGAGRTDAGVNASMMPAHFDAALPMPPEALARCLNSIIGRDIAVEEIIEVHPEAHARFDATSRTYHYHAIGEKSPFVYPLTWRAPASLDYEAMNEAARLLLSTDDFTSFAKLHSDAKTNLCRVSRAEWIPTPGGRGMTFVITADRFLRNMVRAIVGTLVEVGRHKLSIEGFGEVIASRNRCAAGTSMPPQALFLARVTYPYLPW